MIVVFAALLNVLLVLGAPKYFSESLSYKPDYTERQKTIIEAMRKGLPLTLDDLKYHEEQGEIMTAKSLKRAEEEFSGIHNPKIETRSVVLVTAISLAILALLGFFGFFGTLEAFVYFSITSMLVLLFAPIGAGQLFLIVIASAVVAYFGANYLGRLAAFLLKRCV